jgi:hypothetical protein
MKRLRTLINQWASLQTPACHCRILWLITVNFQKSPQRSQDARRRRMDAFKMPSAPMATSSDQGWPLGYFANRNCQKENRKELTCLPRQMRLSRAARTLKCKPNTRPWWWRCASLRRTCWRRKMCCRRRKRPCTTSKVRGRDQTAARENCAPAAAHSFGKRR